jgi:hypothetical protein
MAQPTNEVRRRAFGSILSNAIFRWESLVTLVVTGILFLFVKDISLPLGIPFESWYWLVVGAIAEGALVISALTDPEAEAEAVARAFEQKFNLSKIRSDVSRRRLEQALEYRRNMRKLADRHGGALRVSLLQTVNDVSQWIAHMYDLALHIDAFESDDLVKGDRRTVPQQVEKARQRLAIEADPAVKRDLQEQIRTLQVQLENLESTTNSVKRAEIQLDSTLSSLGTVYAQMSALGTKEVDSARAQRLRNDIKDEVNGLQDTIAALDEVQAQRLRLQ